MRNLAKRAISLLCVLSMLFSMVVNSSAQTSTTVSVESQTIEQGAGTENVEVPIKISNNTGILGITISVTFDEELTLINAVKGDVLEDLTLTKPKNYEVKPYNLVWDGEGSADTGNGIVAVLTFTVPKGTAKDYAVNITTSGVFDEDVQPFEVTAVSGKISVVGGQQQPSSETTISVESQTIEQGTGTEDVEVPIKIANNTGILGITVSVTFDEDLTLVNAVKGDVFGGLTLTKPKDYTVRPYNLVWDGQEGADTDDGTIAVLTFSVPKGTAKDYAINITTSGVFDEDVQPFTPTAVSGKISVVGGQQQPSSETTISVESQTIEQGTGTEDVEVPIKIANNTGILGITVSVTFDEDLTLVNAVKGDVFGGLTLTKPKDYTVRPYNLVWDGQEGADTDDGTIAVLTFAVPKGTAKDYAVNITTSGVFDGDVQPFTPTAVSGKISVVGGQQQPSSETTISVESQTIEQGTGTEDVEVPIKIANNTGILGITISVTFDEDLTLVNAVKGDALSSLTLTKPKDYTVRPYNLVWDGEGSADVDDGIAAVLTFTVPKGTVKDYAINITTSGVFDENVQPFIPTAVSGKISVIGGQSHNHTFGNWTRVDDNTHKRVCECSEEEVKPHSWDAGTITTQPTHTAFGVKTYTCEDGCGATKTEDVAKLPDHSFGDWTKVDDTNHERECACGSKETEAHAWDAGVVTTPATHITTGVKTYTCSECSGTKTEVIPADADNHFFGNWTKVDDNNHKRVCECNEEEVKPHNWGEGIITTPATHTEFGVRTYTCPDCSATKTEQVAKLPDHSYGAWTKVDDNTHSKSCECGDVVTDVHNWDAGIITTPATHTTTGVKTYTCSECSGTKTEVIPADADNHSFGEWVKVDNDTHKRVCECNESEVKLHSWDEGTLTKPATHTETGVRTYTCKDNCGATKTETIDKTPTHSHGAWVKDNDTTHSKSCECGDVITENHNWDEGVITTPATHTTIGVKTYTCEDDCGATKTEDVAKLPGHTFGDWSKVDDEKHSRSCECGETETDIHDWDAGVVTTPATHTTTGVKTYTCSECSGTKTEVIPADADNHSFGNWTKVDENNHKRVCECNESEVKPHSWDEGTITKPATHTETGVRTYTCKDNCGATKTETIDKTPTHSHGAWVKDNDTTHSKSCECGDVITETHNWNDGEITTPATHTTTGVKTFTCKDGCGATKTVDVAKLPEHTFGEWTKVDDNNHKRVCECNEEEVKPHNWGEGIITTPATHTEFGVRTYTCPDCSATNTEQVSKLPDHSYGAWTKVDDNTHSKSCECGDVVTDDHNWDAGVVTTPATHTTTGIKTFTCEDGCGATKTETIDKIPTHSHGSWEKDNDDTHSKRCECGDVVTDDHNWDAGVVTTPATHTSTGIKTYTCSECGGTKTETIPADADNHSFGEWVKVDNDTHKRVCECNEEEVKPHTWDEGEITTPATHTTTGIKTYTCEDDCGATKTEDVAKLPGHSHGAWVKDNDTTHSKSCECGDVITENHNWDAGVITTPTTHTEFGVRTYTCPDCSATKTEQIAKLPDHSYGAWTKVDDNTHSKSCECGDVVTDNHNWDAGVVTTPATHTTTGIKTFTCEDGCGATKTETIDKIPTHSHESWEKDNDDTHSKRCECGDVITENHNWDAGVVTTPATHTTIGVKTYTCSECSGTKTETIPADADNHFFGEWVKVDNDTHKRVCECNESEVKPHKWGEGEITTPATHTEFGVRTYTCPDCSATKTEQVAKLPDHLYGAWTKVDDNTHSKSCECGDVITEDHNWDAGVITTPATHTTTGVKTYTCEDDCGATKTEDVAKLPGHTFGNWTNVDGENHSRECECGETETAAHNWDEGEITTPATHTTTGIKTYTCEDDCGATKTEDVAKLPGHTFGDWTNVDENNHKRVCECDEEEVEPHNWGEGIITTPATHTEFGVRTYTCPDCSATKTETVPVLTPVSSGRGGVTKYTIKYETNGGTVVKSVSVRRNSAITKPADPTKEGFEFDGWYVDKELTEIYDFSSKVTKGFTLYAKWKEIEKEPEIIEPAEEQTFVDVSKEDWFNNSVEFVVTNNLMNGVSDKEFAPNATLTRAMLVTVLYRNEGEPATNRSIPFGDVDMGSYYGNAVSWAKQNGIVSGVSENEFAPDANITREQIAAILFRYTQYKGMDAVTSEENLHFTDSNEISEYAVSAMNWAVGKGLIKGKSETALNPKDNATRAEIAAILQRFIEGNK